MDKVKLNTKFPLSLHQRIKCNKWINGLHECTYKNMVYLRKIHDVVQIEIRLYSGSRYLQRKSANHEGEMK